METIVEALNILPTYGFPPPGASSSVWPVLLAYAPEHPLLVYSTAAAHNSELICSQASLHTLGTSLGFITKEDAVTMGPIYLRRLSLLHDSRVAALKRIISRLPEGHIGCPFHLQALAWKEGIARVLLEPEVQNTSVSTLVATFGPLATHSDCLTCKERVTIRIKDICREWAAVSRTI